MRSSKQLEEAKAIQTFGESTDSIGNHKKILRDGIVECVYGQTHVAHSS